MAADEQPAEPGPTAPVLRVVNGDATPEEVAAIVAVLASLGGGAAAPAATPPPEWNAPRRLTQVTYPSGPGAWRSSGLPR